MLKSCLSFLFVAVCTLGTLGLSACAPKYDWREVHGTNVPFIGILPAKPASFSRSVNLDGTMVTMTMMAAEIDHVAFAIGTAELPNAAQAEAALIAMKTALVKNIGGIVTSEKRSPSIGPSMTFIDIEATGTASKDGNPQRLIARFAAKDRRVYQVIVIGKEKALSRDAIDVFLASFKPL